MKTQSKGKAKKLAHPMPQALDLQNKGGAVQWAGCLMGLAQ